MKKTGMLLLAFVLTIMSTAQAQQEPEMADAMRANGKIYVVVAIVLVVFAGLATYLFVMDRKISKIEKKVGGKA